MRLHKIARVLGGGGGWALITKFSVYSSISSPPVKFSAPGTGPYRGSCNIFVVK